MQDVIRDNEAHQSALISPNSVTQTLVVLALGVICHLFSYVPFHL